MTVLYVDDDEDDLQLFKEAAEEIDSSIICLLANSGHEPLVLLENGASPDLIFLDITMPEMDGVTCLTKIREMEKFQETKIILMSVSLYIINKERIKSLNAGFIKKPNNYTDLVLILAGYFNKSADNLSISEPL